MYCVFSLKCDVLKQIKTLYRPLAGREMLDLHSELPVKV